MSKKILVATEKPFAKQAVVEISEIIKKIGYELTLLESYKDKQELLDAVKNAEAMIIRSDKITEEVIAEMEEMKVIVRAGAGYDNIDLKAATAKNIVAMNTPGQNSNAVAELAIGMMIYLARGQFNGKAGSELLGKTIGIHAYGNVGRNVARIAHGFGMKVVAFDPYVAKEVIEKDGVTPLDTVEEMYETCDYISLHLPSIPATQRFVNYKLIKIMKKGAAIINTARKEVVCEDGLSMIFSERDDLKYASDVAPVTKDELIEKFGNRVYFTPKKMGAQTLEANINAGVAAIQQIINYFEKNDTTFQVNK
ncbi:MAG: 3-phosphoglycerate dehydrogenase [Candidatus Cloacimonetes bacterium]|nr:3-phosphoglycerate dehydrogenase [Candidatus Cloacimonadota bacterium]